MGVLIRKPGILTTVQDLGRFGSRSLGINPNGVMDTAAARTINIALGNDENDAVLEMHFPAAEIEFTDNTAFAIGGSDLFAELDDLPIRNWTTAFATAGSVLRFSKKVSGNRSYLAVKGGFQVSDWLGSRSTNLAASVGGFKGRSLIADDVIECEPSEPFERISIGRSLIPRYSRFPIVRVVAGAEYHLLTALSERAFANEMFTLTTDSNRMGFRLNGEPLFLLHRKEIVSAAVSHGTIQLLPDGQMIVLMADHQTSGGYPRIGNIISADLPVAAQLGPNDRVGFKVVSIAEAEKEASRIERDLTFFKVACGLKRNLC